MVGVPQEVWFPVATLLLGIFSKGLIDLALEGRKSKIARRARKEEISYEARLRRNNFQRETLLELQDVSAVLLRSMGKGHVDDQRAMSNGSKWGTTQLSADANQGAFDANQRMGILTSRVTDRLVRDLSANISASYAQRSLAASERDSLEIMNNSASIATEQSDRIGLLLRTLYEAEDQLLEENS